MGVVPARTGDLPSLVALEETFPARQRWGRDAWREELVATNRHTLVWRAGDTIEAAATFAVAGDVVDLHRIITAPSARRRGLASELLAAGLQWAREQGATRMLLEMEATNTAALALYARHGFRRIAERRDYYAPGVHAVVLEAAPAGGGTS